LLAKVLQSGFKGSRVKVPCEDAAPEGALEEDEAQLAISHLLIHLTHTQKKKKKKKKKNTQEEKI